ncbi:hypothetical protein PoB_004990600 [Plakobranchus ocellatus]|uniref:Uncharacterized protein n=1 Tax=Plakobranchus ocellatus TaxID=259542 RepID=A0AAV4BWC3_9GAST|nr:hypothetical protein PoB_004990600 [Plakobranchus ocellatus]
MAAPTETYSRCASKLSLKAAEAALTKDYCQSQRIYVSLVKPKNGCVPIQTDVYSLSIYVSLVKLELWYSLRTVFSNYYCPSRKGLSPGLVNDSVVADDEYSEDSWRPDSKSDGDESFEIPPPPTNNKVPNISRTSIINGSACTPSAVVNNTAPVVPVAPVINDASCAPLAQVDNTAPDTPPVQVVNTDACAPSASVKNAALYVPGVPANNAATNAPLAPNNKADAPSPVAPTTNEVVMSGRRRKRNSSPWKRHCLKKIAGEEYIGHRGKIHSAASGVQHVIATKKVSKSYCRLVSISICKQALASILGIIIAKINYVCDFISPEDKQGKHQSPPNKLTEEKKQEVFDFLDSIPKYRSHYTRRHNPQRHYLSPSLTQTKLHKLYVEKCASKAIEPVSSRMLSETFVTERNFHFGKTRDKLEMDSRANPLDGNINSERELHLRKAEAGQEIMKNDIAASKANNGQWTIAFDFQQTLPTPQTDIQINRT